MSHGPVNCGPDTGDTDWRHVFFEVCIEWGQVLDTPYELMTPEFFDYLIETYGVDGPTTATGVPGYYMTGCGRRATPNSGWQSSHPAHPAYQAWYMHATSYSGGAPGIGSNAQGSTYVPPSGLWGGGVFMHCVKFNGRHPDISDIGQWVDFTSYAGFPMWLRVCEIGPQCSYTPNSWPASISVGVPPGTGGVDELWGGHYDFVLHSSSPCQAVNVSPIFSTTINCRDTLSCPCGWTPIYDHPTVGELACESPPTGAGTLDAPQRIIMPAIERYCMLLEDPVIPNQFYTPQVQDIWENQPANPAVWNQLAWEKVWIVETGGYGIGTNIEMKASLPCTIPHYVDAWPLPLSPTTP